MKASRRVARMAACGAVALVCLAGAVAADNVAAERQRIRQERAAADAAHAARVADCEQRFVVTSCVQASQRELRETLDRLRQQQVALDEAQRKQRAADRIDAIRRKVAADEAQRPPVISPAASANLTLRAQKPRPPEAAASRPPKADGGPAKDPQRGSRQRERTEREAEVRAHREAVEKRNAARLASGRPAAASLPVPQTMPAPAASAPR